MTPCLNCTTWRSLRYINDHRLCSDQRVLLVANSSVLQLNRPIVFGDAAKAIRYEEPDESIQTATIAGWGLISVQERTMLIGMHMA